MTNLTSQQSIAKADAKKAADDLRRKYANEPLSVESIKYYQWRVETGAKIRGETSHWQVGTKAEQNGSTLQGYSEELEFILGAIDYHGEGEHEEVSLKKVIRRAYKWGGVQYDLGKIQSEFDAMVIGEKMTNLMCYAIQSADSPDHIDEYYKCKECEQEPDEDNCCMCDYWDEDKQKYTGKWADEDDDDDDDGEEASTAAALSRDEEEEDKEARETAEAESETEANSN